MRRDSCVDFDAIYVKCLFVCLLNFLPHFLPSLFSFLMPYFLTHLLPDLSIYSFQNRPFRFQAGGRSRRPNLALVFWFILCCSIFCYGCVFAFVVCFSFSVLSQELGWEERIRNDLFCVGWDVKP